MLATIDLHVHESCMRVAVRVLHSCAFIITMKVYGLVLSLAFLLLSAPDFTRGGRMSFNNVTSS